MLGIQKRRKSCSKRLTRLSCLMSQTWSEMEKVASSNLHIKGKIIITTMTELQLVMIIDLIQASGLQNLSRTTTLNKRENQP